MSAPLAADQMMALGVYVHLPFCPYICPYCDFAKWPMQRRAGSEYLDAISAEIEREKPALVATIFLGGGTPNAYDAQAIAALLVRLRKKFAASDDIAQEISIEVNPELVRPGDFELYRAAGINRVSIGVQSFEPDEIRTLGRKHTAEQVCAVVAQARASGILSVSLDLMFAVPGQTPQSWRRSLDRALDLGADHISTYGLTIEEHTRYAGWYAREPNAFFDDTHEAELYEIAIATLEAAGFEHYEISNFARVGHRSRHNANYWANGEYVGLGVGAASYRDGVRSLHTRDRVQYVAAARAGAAIPTESERLTGLKRVGEAIMLALRTAQGVDLAGFKERYGVDMNEQYGAQIESLSSAGAIERNRGFLRLTKRGRFVANDVCEAFLTLD